jgi:hypothetical protein
MYRRLGGQGPSARASGCGKITWTMMRSSMDPKAGKRAESDRLKKKIEEDKAKNRVPYGTERPIYDGFAETGVLNRAGARNAADAVEEIVRERGAE